MGALHSHGFAWLKFSKSEMRSFHRLQKYTVQPDSCFDQAGKVLKYKSLVQYNTGMPISRLLPATCTAADRVCKVMDQHARQILEAISRSRYLGLTSSSLNCILESVDSPCGQAAASSLDIAQYRSPSQPHRLGDEAHVDRGLVTLIWSNSTSGLQVGSPKGGQLNEVEIPEGYMLVLTGYTLEHVTCGIFKAAPHNMALSEPAKERLSFAYKLRSPNHVGLHQFHNVAANGMDHTRTRGMTVSELMKRFDQHHKSINQVTDLVRLGLSPEWQQSVNEWRTTRHPVDDDWIWRRLVSTMGWQRPSQTMHFKTLTGRTCNLHVHPTWKIVGVESILEVVYDIGAAGDQRLIFAGRQLVPDSTLSETGAQDGSTMHIVLKLLGD